MTATTVDSHLYAKTQYPLRDPAGTTWVAIEYTVATTSLDEAGDVVRLFKVPNGVEIIALAEQHADLDSGGGNLDMDIVLVDDDNLIASPVILYNAATAFNAATTNWLWVPPADYLGQGVVSQGEDAAYIGLKVNVAASTAASGIVRVLCAYRGKGAGGV